MIKALFLLLIFSVSQLAYATVTTARGKITFTQGHISPSCRTVGFKDNATGAVTYFRIKEVAGDDDIAAIVLAALMSNRDVEITYEPGSTSGCGGELMIWYVSVF